MLVLRDPAAITTLLVALALPLPLPLCCTPLSRPSDPQPVKTYNVDLNSDPRQRWNEVLHDHRHYVPAILDMIRSFIPQDVLPLAEQIAEDIENLIPSPFAQEITGIANYWGMNVGDMILLNIIYDITAYCTSVVAQDGNRVIWHARNLDYESSDLLRNLTISVNFRHGNKTLYQAVTVAGYAGVLTGQRPHGFTVSVDQRGSKKHRLGPWWENELTAILYKSSSFVTFLIRQTLEETQRFSEAVLKMSTTVIHAPVYIIVGGASQGEGVVITRDRVAALDRFYLNPLQGRWYVLETNYDHWLPAPAFDSERRAVGHREMDKLGSENVNSTTLYQVLSTAPVLNNYTTYTTVMSASQPEVFNTQVRWPPL
ncbi:N-acylethanolamine-hydrolyzing acid amidase-like [Babylonia areolata]|uniref:N-acylethanolamine-hydrolyzing acid amidase-like n=1 Tax=Babylonia areolata TaxID=304850 RepID=UPI003FD4DC97